ncbi:hypothetical protein EBT31_08825 [bacterium]|jgi:hypothetical protein|nr:hypothetical protein [bacterium]
MAHFNESWDLPPLVGSCYMYGPQRAEGYTKERVEEILANKEALLILKRSFDDIYALAMASVSLEEVNLLTSCMSNLGNVMRARRDKIPKEFL